MIIGIILGIVFVLAMGGSGVYAYVSFARANNYENQGKEKKYKTIGTIMIILAIVALLLFIFIPFSFHTINTGEVAVVKHLGEAVNTREAGTHFDFWVTESYQRYDTKVQNIDISDMAYSSDAQTMGIQMTIQYQIRVEQVMEIAKQYGSLAALQSRIQSIAVEKTKSELSAHKAMDIISNRAAMSPAVEQAVKNAVGNDYFINVTAVVLTNIDFSDAFEQAVEEKMVAEQNKLKADYENETKIAQAEADAKAKIVAAEADAKSKTIAAEAEKTANELVEKSITDKILQKEYLDKWDGKLPNVMAGDNSNNSFGFMLPTN